MAAEDTRRTRVLLEHIGHRAPALVSLHEHNEQDRLAGLLQTLGEGLDVAVVSDAGTPLLNDPGYLLVQAAMAAGVRTVPVPGPSAVTAALSVCPLPCHPFRYVGFLAAKPKTRQQQLSEYLMDGDAIVFLESPRRIVATLTALESMTERRIMLARELTKQYETLYVGRAQELLVALGPAPKGEFTGVIENGEKQRAGYDQRHVVKTLLQELPPAKAAKLAAAICKVPKTELYDLAVSLTGHD